MKSYDYKISIDTFDVGPKNLIKLSSILKYHEEAGEKHMTEGFSLDYNTLRDKGVVFVITNCSVKISRLPSLKEDITINTWNKGVHGFKFIRNFDWIDKSGNIIIEGSSVCVLVDAIHHKIVRPDAYEIVMPEDRERENSVKIPKKIKMPENLSFCGKRHIFYSMLDGNDHLNNSYYADFITDFADENILFDCKGFMIDFVRESLLENDIAMKSVIENNEFYISGEIEGNQCFRAKLEF